MELDFSKIDAVVAELAHRLCPIFVTRKYVASCLGRERLHDAIEYELEDYLVEVHNVKLVRYEEKGFYFIKDALTIGSDSDLSKERTKREEQILDAKNKREGLAFLVALQKENTVPPSITWESCQQSLSDNLEYIEAILSHGSVPSGDITRMFDEYKSDINRINSFVCYLFEEDEFESDEDEFMDDYRELVSQTESLEESLCEALYKAMDPNFDYEYVSAPGEYAVRPVFNEINSILDSYRDIVFNVIDFKVQFDLDNA